MYDVIYNPAAVLELKLDNVTQDELATTSHGGGMTAVGYHIGIMMGFDLAWGSAPYDAMAVTGDEDGGISSRHHDRYDHNCVQKTHVTVVNQNHYKNSSSGAYGDVMAVRGGVGADNATPISKRTLLTMDGYISTNESYVETVTVHGGSCFTTKDNSTSPETDNTLVHFAGATDFATGYRNRSISEKRTTRGAISITLTNAHFARDFATASLTDHGRAVAVGGWGGSAWSDVVTVYSQTYPNTSLGVVASLTSVPSSASAGFSDGDVGMIYNNVQSGSTSVRIFNKDGGQNAYIASISGATNEDNAEGTNALNGGFVHGSNRLQRFDRSSVTLNTVTLGKNVSVDSRHHSTINLASVRYHNANYLYGKGIGFMVGGASLEVYTFSQDGVLKLTKRDVLDESRSKMVGGQNTHYSVSVIGGYSGSDGARETMYRINADGAIASRLDATRFNRRNTGYCTDPQELDQWAVYGGIKDYAMVADLTNYSGFIAAASTLTLTTAVEETSVMAFSGAYTVLGGVTFSGSTLNKMVRAGYSGGNWTTYSDTSVVGDVTFNAVTGSFSNDYGFNIGGGVTGNSSTNKVRRYYGLAATYSEQTALDSERIDSACMSYDDHLLIVGGRVDLGEATIQDVTKISHSGNQGSVKRYTSIDTTTAMGTSIRSL